MTTNNILTAVGVTSATCATLMAQTDPMIGDRLGLMGALIALLVLVVRTVNELGRAWLAYEESQLETKKLKERVTVLERERDTACAERSSGTTAPATAELPVPICRFGLPGTTPGHPPTEVAPQPDTPQP